MIIDFATGIGKQYRIDREKITSHAAWLGVMKKVATMTSVLSVAFVFKAVNFDTSGYLDSILAILVMAEGYSIIQNAYAIRTGKILPEFDVVSILLKHISDFLKHRIESSVESNEKNDKHP